jgi:hypothetical protein
MSAGVKTVGKAVGEKVSGGQPGPVRSFAAAAVVGAVAAVVTYKALRK